GRGGPHRFSLPQPPASLHGASDREPAASRRCRPEIRTVRGASQSGRPAAGLPLPSPLPAGERDLPAGGATARGPGAGTSRRLLSPGTGVVTALLELDRVSRRFGDGLFRRRQVMAV